MKTTMTKIETPGFTIKLDGTSIWSDTSGIEVKVSGYAFSNKNETLSVYHDQSWDIYTDEAFEDAITEFIKNKHPELGIDYITFSEQGLQDDGEADMDVFFN